MTPPSKAPVTPLGMVQLSRFSTVVLPDDTDEAFARAAEMVRETLPGWDNVPLLVYHTSHPVKLTHRGFKVTTLEKHDPFRASVFVGAHKAPEEHDVEWLAVWVAQMALA